MKPPPRTVYGTWTITGNVLDSSGNSILISNTLTINPAFVQTANTISNTLADQGQAELLTASWSGGTSTYTANYFIVNSNGNVIANALYTGLSGTSNTFSFTILSTNNAVGTDNVIITLTDSATTNVALTSVNTITVNSAPTITLSSTPASPGGVDSGNTITFNALASGGSSPYTTYTSRSTTVSQIPL